MSISEDNFLKIRIHPSDTIPKSPQIDDFKQYTKNIKDKGSPFPPLNNEALSAFLNIFKQT